MPQFIALPAFTDNYIWLLLDERSRQAAVVDPGDAVPVIKWLGRHPDYTLSTMLITHHHRDHTGGLTTIKAATGCKVLGPDGEDIAGVDKTLKAGDEVRLFGEKVEVIDVPGHTRGHIAYFGGKDDDPWLLSGDTLFAGGCGRLFEGTPEQMYASLQRLAQLPDATRVYCAHEYTQANLRFARAVEPANDDIRVRLEVVDGLRAAGRMTLPSSVALEKLTNPFLRCSESAVIEAASSQAGKSVPAGEATFAQIRAWKDRF